MDALLAGRAGLAAASAGTSTTSNNIANASTPGFTRRTVSQTTGTPVRHGAGWFGSGPRISAITRRSDALLGMQRVDATASEARATEELSLLRRAESVLQDGPSAPRSRLDAFYASLTSATRDPGDPTARAEVLDRASDLAESFQRAHGLLQDLRDHQDSRMASRVDAANDVLSRIADLNGQLVAAGGPEVAGDLADERDQLLRQAAELVGATAHLEEDGGATVFIGGHAVVSGDEARALGLQQDDPPTVVVAVDKGEVPVDPGGQVGGALDAATRVRGYSDALDAAALAFAEAMNTAHSAGFDASGAAGADLFSFDPTRPASSIAVAVTSADQLAFAGDATAARGDGKNLSAMLDVENTPLGAGETTSESLSALVATVGQDTARAERASIAEGQTLADLEAMTASLEGVDLDEEAANLMMYQAAYRAAAKVVAATDQMMGTLLELV